MIHAHRGKPQFESTGLRQDVTPELHEEHPIAVTSRFAVSHIAQSFQPQYTLNIYVCKC